MRNDADWAYFQDELDKADLVVLGRLGHEANPNSKGRSRLIVSSSSSGLDERPDGWWWNPDRCAWEVVAATLLPNGGRVAVPGGRRVFDLFLGIGYDTFHLTRAEAVTLGNGTSVFSCCDHRTGAGAALYERGLEAGPRRMLDPDGPVSLTLWRR
nr:hypothetical protein [Microvirga antarctica]